MAIWASKIYLRWYKAFNTATTLRLDAGLRPWENFNGKIFPFVEVPISRRICTVVGANEAGKSQLLSAVEKVLRGKTRLGKPYSPHDICRYCGLLSATEDLWPELGIEFSFETAEEFASCATALGFAGSSADQSERKLRIFVRGDTEEYATVYNASGDQIGTLEREEWHEKNKCLPAPHLIRANLDFSNQVHISQLIAHGGESKATAYEPLELQGLADELITADLARAVAEQQAAAQQPNAGTPTLDAFKATQKRVAAANYNAGDGGLEAILFYDILKIPRSVLKRIRELKSSQSGYVEQLVADMNHRLTEALDISTYWQQDEDFELTIEYKAGFFYFFITDRTGAKYTFDERSGGLKYFLSYYIQAKAIRDGMGESGAIIVMDEPDGFLSAAGQRNLLSVFELLAQPTKSGGKSRCAQVIYTTHSPFLINRNYPDRISLVRKGDGGEGTQHVELVSTRQYEPVRTGLGIEAAETLFMGTENVVLEEVSAQRVIVAAIQHFGDPSRIDDFLDLNRVTFVSAGGLTDVPRLLRTTKRSKEKQPVAVLFVDGDEIGRKTKDEIVGEGLIDSRHVGLISDSDLPTSQWCDNPETLEDIIPPKLLSVAISAFAKERWSSDTYTADAILEKWNSNADVPAPKRLIEVTKFAGGGLSENVTEIALKAGVHESLARLIVERPEVLDTYSAELQQLNAVVRKICERIAFMLREARTKHRQDKLSKGVRIEIERFKKIHGETASKADVRRCLAALEVLPIGSDMKASRTRENIILLQRKNEDEVEHAGHEVRIPTWMNRLDALLECPWTEKPID